MSHPEGFKAFRPTTTPDTLGREHVPDEDTLRGEAAREHYTREQIQELYRDFFNKLRSIQEGSAGALYTNPGEFWKEVQRQNRKELVVRKDNPWFLLPTLADKNNVEIFFRADVPYNNSAVWDPHDISESSGLKAALYEGHSNAGGAISIYGFDPDQAHLEAWDVEKMDFIAGRSRENARSISGTVPLDAVRFVVERFPLHLMPTDILTEEEMDRKEELAESGSKNTYQAYAWRGVVMRGKEEKAAS